VKEAAKKKTEDKSAKTDEKKSTLKKITSRTKKEDK
jgi:hypothetical protein